MGGILVLGFCLFMLNYLGAGDGKMLAVTGLWLGPQAAFLFVTLVGLFGGILALTILVMRGSLLPVWVATHPVWQRLSGKDRSIPYAIAIAPAALLSLADSPWGVWVPFLAWG